MKNVRAYLWLGVGVALAVGLVVPPAGWAQAAKAKKAEAAAPVEIEEITVTAQKREENIQEIPISVTALSGEVLARKGLTDVISLTQAVPNLRIEADPGTTSSTSMGMRGMQLGDPNLAFQTVVGLYVDGAYISKMVGSNLDLEDLERVEVLRGPQGTLYGRNTIGGAVNFITNKPTEQRSISLLSEVGNYETFNSRLTFNAPLVGKNGLTQSEALGTLSWRQTVGYKSHDGYFTNALPPGAPAQPGVGGGSEFNNLNRLYNMTALRWQPNKDVTLDYWFEYHRYNNSSMANPLTYIYPGSLADSTYNYHPPGSPPGFVIPIPNPVFPGGLGAYIQKNRPDSTPANAVLKRDGSLHRMGDSGRGIMHNLTLAWDLGDVGPFGKTTLKAIGSYRSFYADTRNDFDGTPLHVIDIMQMSDVQHWSGELQWLGTGPRYHYVLGMYYFGEYAMQDEDQTYFFQPVPSKNYIKSKSYAPYGQVTYTPPILSDKLSITAGLRFTQEQVHLDHMFFAPGAEFSVSRGKAFGGIHGTGTPGLSPMGDLSYQWTDEVMTYFRVSRGFRSGGFTPTAPTPFFTTPFNPEKLLAYEMGFKTQWFDNRLRLNADGFYSDYSDLQETVFRATPGLGAYSVVGNVESAEIWGMEFEGTAVPVRGIEATVGYSFIAPKYLKWMDQKFDAAGNPIFDSAGNPVLEDVADHRAFPHLPHSQFSAGVTYTAPPTTHGTFSAHLDVYWQDKVVFITNNETPGSQADEGWAYALVNGQLRFADIPLQKGSLDLAVYGRNLFDRKYRTYGIDWTNAIGVASNNYGTPRTFGLQIGYNFTAGEAAPPPAPVAQAAPPPPPPAKKKIVLRSVHFDFDKATLKADAKPILDEAIQVLKQEGSVDIVVEGHTDSIGTETYNMGLSRRRAETVRSYLVDHGIARSRITAEGMGESKPVASNDTADGRAQNRRVELHVK
ncbi:MAG: OmpA family protein [Candidatus Binatia bacterium]